MRTEKEVKELENAYLSSIDESTPEEVKENPVIDLDEEGEIELTITGELIDRWGLEEWLQNYKREAKFSTSGIRGPQNVLYYWDTRFPLNQLGVLLATLGKARVLKEERGLEDIDKIAAGEVRYNTDKYIELISRAQASMGVRTHMPDQGQSVPVWLVSFLIYLFDYDGGEYVTSSHAVSSKIATKDLDGEGSQFPPEVSLQFVSKIEDIIRNAKTSEEGYKIKLASKDHELIKRDFNGCDLYTDYLRSNVATEDNLKMINEEAERGFSLMFDCCGGCMYSTMSSIVDNLRISEAFDWNHREEDPFFHGIGKKWREDPETGEREFFDLSCDATLIEVVETMNYDVALKDKSPGYIVLITDPDGDRLVVGQVEPAENTEKMEKLGINYIEISEDKVFAVYHPTYSFLMIMDFYMKQLKERGVWDDHSRFLITTTPSSYAWNEWAEANGITPVSTPVGFKEIALVMKKVEKQILEDVDEDVVIHDIWGDALNLGKDPRLVFGGEESGGMILGPENLIESRGGRKAIAMREKSAGEASIIATVMAAHLHRNDSFLSEYLEKVFEENDIDYRHFIRDEVIYYNESEPNPEKLKKEKKEGEIKRNRIDRFFLGISLGLRKGIIDFDQAKTILSETFDGLEFSNLEDIFFVGDGTYFKFDKMFVEVRRSGTDAKMKCYTCGDDRARCKLFMDKFLSFEGEKPEIYSRLIPKDFQDNLYDIRMEIYSEYYHKDLDK